MAIVFNPDAGRCVFNDQVSGVTVVLPLFRPFHQEAWEQSLRDILNKDGFRIRSSDQDGKEKITVVWSVLSSNEVLRAFDAWNRIIAQEIISVSGIAGAEISSMPFDQKHSLVIQLREEIDSFNEWCNLWVQGSKKKS